MFAPAPELPLDDDSGPARRAEPHPEQRAGARHPGGHLLPLAGAGPGKTTALCARVACLVETGVPAERILLLTFTRRAAREMLARGQRRTGRGAPGAHGGQLHGARPRTD